MRILFYLLPALMNITTGLLFFVSAKRTADSGASSYMVALTMVAWALFYATTSFLAGFVINKRNAMRFLMGSQLILLAALCGLAFAGSLHLQFLWLSCVGAGGAMFFTSFQSVIKILSRAEYALDAMVKNSAVYTFSWSTGLALGPFIAAFVWGLFDATDGWRYCYFIAILLQLLVAAGVAVVAHSVRRRRLAEPEAGEAGEGQPEIPEEQRNLPDLMAAGWWLQGLGYIAVAMMRTYLPDYCTKELAMSTFHQGIVMSLVSFAQAFAGLACYSARRWPYRPWVIGAVSVAAAGAFLVFAFTGVWQLYALAAVMLGVFSGMMCFTATFHALVNPLKSARYVAVNEMLVGIGSVGAPMLGGLLASHCSVLAPFFCCLACLLLCAAIYGRYTWRPQNP